MRIRVLILFWMGTFLRAKREHFRRLWSAGLACRARGNDVSDESEGQDRERTKSAAEVPSART